MHYIIVKKNTEKQYPIKSIIINQTLIPIKCVHFVKYEIFLSINWIEVFVIWLVFMTYINNCCNNLINIMNKNIKM